jgi:hypothetical protein
MDRVRSNGEAVHGDAGSRAGPCDRCIRSLILIASSWLAVACTSMTTAPEQPARIYSGQLDVVLEPFDARGKCSITIGLRNTSGVRQGDANLKLAWFDSAGALLAEQALRMDGLLEGRYDAKNLALPVPCRQVGQLAVRTAEWNVFEGWDVPVRSVVRIDGVEDTEWKVVWDEENQLFLGRIQSK